MVKKLVVEKWDEISDSDWYKGYRTDEEIKKIIDNPQSAFHRTTWEMLKKIFSDFRGKRICVPSSGDNHAVFAFALLGADVTSCDISQRQIENAAAIAKRNNWNIKFFCDDTMKLSKIHDNTYDLVYTSNGVHVWIDDLNAMYKNIYRIMKKHAFYFMHEIHPFGRPFNYNDVSAKTDIIIEKPYDDIGPHDLCYHWRMQDFINAIINSGFMISHVEEMFAEYGTYWFESCGGRSHLSDDELNKLYDWKTNSLAAIPQWLCISAVK